MTASLLPRESRTAGGHLLGALVIYCAHDLNNHLAAALGKAEIGMLVADADRKTAAFGGILEAGEAARRLVADLQRLAAWSEGAGDPVLPGEIGLLATRLLERRLRRSSCAPRVQGFGPPVARGRAAQAALALWHLLRRFLEATPPDGSLAWEIAVASIGRDAEISIRIEGPALPEHALDGADTLLAEVDARFERREGAFRLVLD